MTNTKPTKLNPITLHKLIGVEGVSVKTDYLIPHFFEEGKTFHLFNLEAETDKDYARMCQMLGSVAHEALEFNDRIRTAAICF